MSESVLPVDVGVKPVLDSGFVPAVLWNRTFRNKVSETPGSIPLAVALQRPDSTTALHETRVLPHEGANRALNIKYVERLIKALLWQRGGSRIVIGGCQPIAEHIAGLYRENGARAFDADLIAWRVYREKASVESVELADMPARNEPVIPLGRNLGGCRIGFDLGGSDRKSAAVIDGEVVFSEEIGWDPYFQGNPQYHIDGINDSIARAAAHLPRVDAIGGSAAGIYVKNDVCVASLFRGVSEDDFEGHIRKLFWRLKARWGGVPLEVANDGEVTALAGAMELDDNAVLGISLGTSQAGGYVNLDGYITTWLNELAFVPVDYRDDAPADEWSGDIGCGVQYFSQQCVARLAPLAGIELPDDMPLPERLTEVQKLMTEGDERARRIYQTIGVYLGYSLAHYAEFYDIRNILLLGRVTTGAGGAVIISEAEELLKSQFPALAEQIAIRTPSEQLKRHGQAIAAASLPVV